MGFGNIRWCQTGGAPMDLDIMNFLRAFFCCPLIEGYGQTETISVAFTSPLDCCIGHIGGPIPSYEIKLIDVPELNYNVKDKIHNEKIECYGRGEICVRGTGLCKGYFEDNCVSVYNNTIFDKDGWLHTGDIAIILPNLAFKIVDRKKNIFKLSQGEFVFVEAVETEFEKLKEIDQIVLYGESTWIYLVCLVIPNKDSAISWGMKELHVSDYNEIVYFILY